MVPSVTNIGHGAAVHAVNDSPDVMADIVAFSALDSVPVAIRGLSVADSDFYEVFHALCQLNVSV